MATTFTPSRVQWVLGRHGIRGAARLAVHKLLHKAYLHEEHVWYVLPLDRAGERQLPDGMRLVRSTIEKPVVAEERNPRRLDKHLREGHELWTVRDGDAVAFHCWIFRGTCPSAAARGGWFELPPGVVNLEDSVTAPDYRGRGIAPAAWDALARALAAEGLRELITKVEVENAPSRKAVLKSGFREVATMRTRRRGPIVHVDIDGDGSPAARALAEQLER
jgi:RimJ/RimL family protein N-acetyltransferase